jgi:serine/threonine-protein kinase RsbW
MTRPLDVAQLTLPNDLSYLPVIGAHTRAIAERAGFEEQDVHRIRLAVDEACTNVIESFEPGETQIFTVISQLDATSLCIAIADKGMPFDLQTIDAYDATGGLERDTGGLSHYLIKQVMDEVRYLNKGWEGKEVQLVKYRATADVESYFAARDLRPYEATAAPPDVPITYRLMQPDEAAKVAQCVYRTYGYTYVSEHIYYPERLADMNRTGEIISAVAVLESGEVVGHCALSGTPDDPIMEMGQAIVSPQYRNRGIIGHLVTLLKQVARERGLVGLFVTPVTTHPYSQRAALKHGFRETGVFLGYAPQTLFFKKIVDEDLPQRETVFYGFTLLDMQAEMTIYPPPNHRGMIQRIYDHVSLPRQLAECPEDVQLPAAPSNLSTHIKLGLNAAQIEVHGYGNRVAWEIAAKLADLRGRGLAVIYLDLPLTDPLTGHFGVDFENLGFIFGGVMPGVQKDVLRLQYLHDVTIDYEKITCASEFAHKLLDYVRWSAAEK